MVRPAMSLKWTNGARLPCFAFLVLFLGVRGCWCLNSEGLALLHLLVRVESDPFGVLKNWDPDDFTPCMWRGVRCLDGKVNMLDLGGQGLKGLLAPELRDLSHLRVLNLSKNQFSGPIPQEFGQLTSLETLDLRNNILTGKIPAELRQLHFLKRLLLGNNRFEGSIPVAIGQPSLQSDLQFDNVCTTAALVASCLNRKFLYCIRECVLKQQWISNSFWPATEGIITCSLKLLQLSKFRDKLSQDHADVNYINPTDSPEPSDVKIVNNEINNVRRRLLEESSNLVAAVPPDILPPPQLDPSLTPPTRSSGSFPAIPKPKAPSPAPSLSPAPAGNHAPATTSPSAGKSENSSMSIVWILLVVFLVIIAIVVFIICRTRAAKKLSPWKSGLSGQLQKAFVTGVPKLKRDELETACEDFSNIIDTIGDGAAMAYKGTLSSGVEIAVVSTTISSQKNWSKRADSVFRKKIDSLSRINHKNFLNLIGYCEENEPFTRMMVFEYAPSGTLHEHLHVKDAEHLDWNARVRIVMGTAYCLQHMHELNPPIPHFNLTSRDILLTDDYAAKVGDMGFWGDLMDKAKKPSGHQSEHSELPSIANVETNVHSFGIMLLEIISGKYPYTKEQGNIVNWAAPYLNDKDSMKNLVDPTLSSCNEKELEVLCEVIKSCIQENEQKRPSMKEFIEKLRQVINISPEAATPRLSPLWWAELEILSAEPP